jgi:hypothetical protein
MPDGFGRFDLSREWPSAQPALWLARAEKGGGWTMAVTSVSTFTLKPDGYQAFLEQTGKAKGILERCGARNFRLMGTLMAGEATGTLVVTYEADDHASFGAVMDKFLADPDGMALIMTTNSADGPIAAFQGSLWSDIEV